MDGFTPKDIQRILAVTDAEKIHRMSVRIPLAPEGRGSARVEGRQLTIVPPAEGDFEAWLAALPEAIRALDLTGVNRTP